MATNAHDEEKEPQPDASAADPSPQSATPPPPKWQVGRIVFSDLPAARTIVLDELVRLGMPPLERHPTSPAADVPRTDIESGLDFLGNLRHLYELFSYLPPLDFYRGMDFERFLPAPDTGRAGAASFAAGLAAYLGGLGPEADPMLQLRALAGLARLTDILGTGQSIAPYEDTVSALLEARQSPR